MVFTWVGGLVDDRARLVFDACRYLASKLSAMILVSPSMDDTPLPFGGLDESAGDEAAVSSVCWRSLRIDCANWSIKDLFSGSLLCSSL